MAGQKRAFRSIIAAITREPKSIKEIANDAGTSRNTTSEYLGFMEREGYVNMKQEGLSKKYYRVSPDQKELTEKLRQQNAAISKLNDDLREIFDENMEMLKQLGE